MTRERNVLNLAFFTLGNVFVHVECKLGGHTGRRRWFLGDRTEEEDLIVVRLAYTSSASVTSPDHSALVTSVFASVFCSVEDALISVAHGGHGSWTKRLADHLPGRPMYIDEMQQESILLGRPRFHDTVFHDV